MLCLCGVLAYAAWAMAQDSMDAQGPTHPLQIAVLNPEGILLPDAYVCSLGEAVGGQDAKAALLPNGTHFVATVGIKVLLEVAHPLIGQMISAERSGGGSWAWRGLCWGERGARRRLMWAWALRARGGCGGNLVRASRMA